MAAALSLARQSVRGLVPGLRLWLVKSFVHASSEIWLFQIGSSSAMASLHAQSICHGLDIPYFQTKVGIVTVENGYTASPYVIACTFCKLLAEDWH